MDWKDLTVSPTSEEIGRAYSLWPDIAGTRLKPLMVTAFGDMFFVLGDSEVRFLDLVDLEVVGLGIQDEEFPSFINQRDNIENYLMSSLVAELLDRGVLKRDSQIYGFAPHPSVSGQITADHVMPMDLFPYLSICAQLGASGKAGHETQ